MTTTPEAKLDDVSFTIVVPTYNEEEDIDTTCDALAHLKGRRPEIIFVDGGSRDATVEKILSHGDTLSLRVIREQMRTGVSRARNLGIRAATGNVLVLLNADAWLPSDFLVKLAAHYRTGATYVKVQSEVANVSTVWCRFLRAQHIHEFSDFRGVGWTEGFSVRTDAAKAVGLFAESLPGAGGEDGDFVQRLEQRYGAGVIDPSLNVRHIAPDRFRPFLRQWYGRGKAVPFVERHVQRRSAVAVVCRRMAAWTMSMVLLAAVVPSARYGWQLSRHTPGGRRDFPGFTAARIVQVVAHRWGEVVGLVEVFRRGAEPGAASSLL